jgi:hypothetical protein
MCFFSHQAAGSKSNVNVLGSFCDPRSFSRTLTRPRARVNAGHKGLSPTKKTFTATYLKRLPIVCSDVT